MSCIRGPRPGGRRGRPRGAALQRLLRAGFSLLAILSATADAGSAAPRVTTDGIVFGSYDAGEMGEKRVVGSITLACDADCPAGFTLTLGASLHGGTAARRRMKHVELEQYVDYALHLEDEGGRPVESVRRAMAAGTALNVRVNGVIPPGQNLAAGRYYDRVTVTVEW